MEQSSKNILQKIFAWLFLVICLLILSIDSYATIENLTLFHHPYNGFYWSTSGAIFCLIFSIIPISTIILFYILYKREKQLKNVIGMTIAALTIVLNILIAVLSMTVTRFVGA